jgi:hypothetical protein
MKLDISPFQSFDDFLSAEYVISNFSDKSRFAVLELIRVLMKHNYSETDLDKFVLKRLYFDKPGSSQFFRNIKKLDEFCSDFLLKKHLFPSFKTNLTCCLFCNATLAKFREVQAFMYLFSEFSRPCVHVVMKCENCNAQHYISYAENTKKERKFYADCLQSTIIAFSCFTVFETVIFKALDFDILYKNSSFDAFCNSFNSLFKVEQEKYSFKRDQLQVKRLTESWFYFKALNWFDEVKLLTQFNQFPPIESLDQFLLEIKSHVFEHFVKKWSGSFH